jgi:2-polyprenyl-3-methyl-5-hydroxy-6-metoxy-1,4-benzoquinol methylase
VGPNAHNVATIIQRDCAEMPGEDLDSMGQRTVALNRTDAGINPRSVDLCSKSTSVPALHERTIGGLHEALFDRIKGLANLCPDTPILDIGCGTGAWMSRLAASGFRTLQGVDRDIGQFAIDGATCSEVDLDTAADLGLGERKFGLITAIEVVEHLENPGRLFFHVARHLSDDGVFLMTTPNIHSVLCRFRFFLTGKLKQFDLKGDQTHIYPVLLTSLQRVLPRYHLVVAGKWSYPTNGGSITSRPIVKIAAGVLGRILPNDDPGDVLCLTIQRGPDSE